MSNLFRKQSLEKLVSTEQLDQMITVVKPSFWIVFLGVVVAIVVILAWGFFGSLPVCLNGTGIFSQSGNDQTVFCYLPVESGKQVQQGMEVTLSPVGDNRQQDSSWLGRVVRVDSYVTDQKTMQEQLDNETLIDYFLQNGPVVAVECQIEGIDRANFPAGTLMDCSIILERKAPIFLFLPSVMGSWEILSVEGDIS